MFTRFSFRVQFIWGAVTFLIIALVLSIMITFAMKILSDFNSQMYKHPFTVSNTVREIQIDIISMHRYMKDVVLSTNTEQMELAIQLVADEEKHLLQHFILVRERFLGDIQLVDRAEKAVVDWAVIRNEVIGLIAAGETETAALITKNKGAAHVLYIEEQMRALLDFANLKAEKFAIKSQRTAKLIVTITIVTSACFILIGFFVLFYMYKSFNNQISTLIFSAHKISNGDYFTVMSDLGKNELGHLSRQFEQMRLSVLQAITDTKDSQKQLQLAMEAANIGLWNWHPKTGALSTNDIFLTMFAQITKDFSSTNHPWKSLVHPDDLDSVYTKIQPYLDGKDSLYRQTYRIQTSNGNWIWVLDVGRVVNRDAEGKAELFTGIIIDITDQKIIENQLIQARKDADIANKAKSEFLANMSHELRTPMHGILSFAGFGLKRSETASREKLNKYFDRISVSGNRLLSLLNDLLDLSKLESGKMELNIKEGNLIALFKGCCQEQEQRMQDLGLTIKMNTDEGAGIGLFDEVRVGQVITNILSNAIKFSPQDSVITTTITNDHENLQFTLQDKGGGIPENELDTIFDAFIQSSNSKTGTGGTGLGLAICKHIIEGHRGHIWAENYSKGGAVFKFTLPLVIQRN